jgi:hypothetical protein
VEYLKTGSRPLFPYSDVRLLPYLQHSFWFLPNVAACHATANLLAEKQNVFWHDYDVVVAAGTMAGIGLDALPPVRQAIGSGFDTRGHDTEDIRRRNEAFAPEPDLLVILDIEPKVSLRRIRMRGDRANHFEKTGTLKKSREIFLSIKKPYSYVLNANQEPEKLRDLIVRQFSAIFAEDIARSDGTPHEKLNATLSLFGGNPI